MLSKYIASLFFICISLLSKFLMADETETLSESESGFEKKYDLSICAVFKNEALYLKDWIEYHLSIGVDHLYLYNIGSRDFYEQILKTYIRDNTVTLVNWPEALVYHDDLAFSWALTTQIPAYENAVNFLAKDETNWLVFLDIDEFLVLSKGSLKNLLGKYSEFPGIAFSTEFFDGAIYNTLNKKTLRDETYEITLSPPEILDKTVTKMIFKPDQCMGFNCPPYQCRFKEFVSCIDVDPLELRVKRFINRNMVHKFFGKNRELKEIPEYPVLFEEGGNKRDRPMYQKIPAFLIKLGVVLE